MEKGVVIIATGNRFYGQMASNLCASIKHLSNMPVCLIYDDDGIESVDRLALFQFDDKIEAKRSGFAGKLDLYDLTPFDKTLYLDADIICTPLANITKLIDSLNGVSFTIANRGLSESKLSDWVDTEKVKYELNLTKWFDTSSEVIYFEKSQVAESVFKSANEFYENNTFVHRTIGGQQPDEPSFSYALSVNDIEPHQSPWMPSFWEPQVKDFKTENDIISEYQFMSMGGKRVSDRIRKLYRRWAEYACKQVSVPYYQHINKQDIRELNRQAI